MGGKYLKFPNRLLSQWEEVVTGVESGVALSLDVGKSVKKYEKPNLKSQFRSMK